ncbi:MAG: hypothetical protein ACRDM8_08425 [Gaiellaceae bacterium]
MTILLIVGVGVVVLGALVLLLFPDRPGGKIAWQGFEVSSIGAGLPLIVVGIAAIAISGGGVLGGADSGGAVIGGDGGNRDSGDQTNPVLECPDLPRTRVVDVPQGANALIIAGPAESKTEPFTLRFIDNNQTVGVLTAKLLPSEIFQIQSFVDADCQTSQIESIEPGGEALDVIPNNTNVRIPDLMGRSYILNLGYGGTEINVNFEEVCPP